MSIRSVALAVFILVLPILILSMVADGNEAPVREEGSISIFPDQTLELTPLGYPIVELKPGESEYIPLWIKNNGTLRQTVVMTVTDGPDWFIAVTGSVDLGPGEEEQITLAINAPDEMLDPSDDYPMRVVGTTNITMEQAELIVIADIEANIDHDLLLSPSNTKNMDFLVHPGAKTYVDLQLRNTGEMVDIYELTILDHPSGWDIQLREGGMDTTFSLDHGDTGYIHRTKVLIGVPTTTNTGDELDVTLRSVSKASDTYDTGKRTDSVRMTFRVVKGSTLTVSPESSFLYTENELLTDFFVTNTGMVDCTFFPDMNIFSDGMEVVGWETAISPGGPFNIEVGSTEEISVRIVPPPGSSGYFNIILGGTSDNGYVEDGEMMTYVRSGSNITIDRISGGPFKRGQTLTFSASISNQGKVEEQVFTEIRGIPDCYLHSIEPSHNIRLLDGQSRDITIELYPMDNSNPLNFEMELVVKTLREETDEWTTAAARSINVELQDLPNLLVKELEVPSRALEEGENVTINVTVGNDGNVSSKDFTLKVYEVSIQFSRIEIFSKKMALGPGNETKIMLNWSARLSARSIRVELVPLDPQEETSMDDNELSEPVAVIKKLPVVSPGGTEKEGISTELAFTVAVGSSVIVALALVVGSSDIIRYPFFVSVYPLYSKLKPEHILSNRLRRRIYVYVQNHPGEHFRGILTNLDLTNGTLAHHLYTLEKEELIRSHRDGLYRRFYPAGYQIDEEAVSLSPIQRRIIELVKEEPGHSQKEISKKLDLSNSTVNYNIKALKDKGMIDIKKKGKSTRIYPVPDQNS